MNLVSIVTILLTIIRIMLIKIQNTIRLVQKRHLRIGTLI